MLIHTKSLLAFLIASCVVGSITMAATPYPGYLFTASGQNAYLISPTGQTVHTWKATSSAQSHADLLPDGSVLFPMQPRTAASALLTNPTACPVTGMAGGFPHGRLQRINWDNQVIWDCIVCDATFTPAYDAEPIWKSDGSFTILVGGISSSRGVKLVEIKPVPPTGKEIVWEYDLPSEALASGFVNSITYNPDLGEGGYIAINYNMGKKIIVIDKAKKSVVSTYSVTSGTGNHAVMWVSRYFPGTNIIQPDANSAAMRLGNLAVVNNSVKAIEIKFNADSKTLTWVKDFTYKFVSHEGSVQRLPNGNTLVQAGMGSNVITELDDNGQAVRTVNAPGTVARAHMYGPTYPGLKTYTTLREPARVLPSRVCAFTHNAATGTGKITMANPAGTPLRMRVYSLSGKTVYSASTRGSEFPVATRTLTAGVFHVEVQHDAGTFRTSFVAR